MAQQANIVAYDGNSTPVIRYFAPDGIERVDAQSTIANWREALQSTSMNTQARVAVKRQKLKSGVQVSTLEVVIPVPEVPTGGTPEGYAAPPKAAYEDRVLVIQYQHPRSTGLSRRAARQLALNIAGNIATSVTPLQSGFWPELADLGIFPS